MGAGSSKTMVLASDFLNAVRKLGKLSENDMKLVECAQFQIAEHMTDKTELFINFKDREPLSCLPEECSKSEIKSQMLIAYDENNKPKMTIQHIDVSRRFSPKTMLLASDFLNAVRQLDQLSEIDMKLRDFAKFQIQEHMMDKTELIVDFKDREVLSCLPGGCSNNEIKSQMLIAYDENNKPKMTIQHIDVLRKFSPKTMLLASDFLNAVRQLGQLSEIDMKLRDFAKFQIQEHMMDKTELIVDFKGRELSCLPEGCSKNEIKSEMLIAYDENNKPKMAIQHFDSFRKTQLIETVKLFFQHIDFFRKIQLLEAVKFVFTAVKAVVGYKKIQN